jgi:hypothetical protein
MGEGKSYQLVLIVDAYTPFLLTVALHYCLHVLHSPLGLAPAISRQD